MKGRWHLSSICRNWPVTLLKHVICTRFPVSDVDLPRVFLTVVMRKPAHSQDFLLASTSDIGRFSVHAFEVVKLHGNNIKSRNFGHLLNILYSTKLMTYTRDIYPLFAHEENLDYTYYGSKFLYLFELLPVLSIL
ncbi:hypothetical protein ASPBRDRAFT_307852 [Aspergillus brasiliensis CBS 101740]|uniref:Uncharacterized protein n=1 Tax=Aspergillus brasiliensis (strain CBS 101740 / IMI 381727 / IBT 21946) TaxID=767769 RepID=A0A1L9UAH2_ASPBC|nr:hypothetical protein ASPBRDRAFT_307852 [Aspergillus brasiliensis CBS 101740]